MSVLYIVNPISGKGGGKKTRILDRIDGHVEFTRYAGHAVELARNASEDTIVAVGGDGTVNEVAKGIAGTGKTLGIIPCGSGDGLARCLGITAAKAPAIISAGKTQPLDWGTIDGHPFVSVCGVGIDAIVSEKFANAGKRGLNTYVEEALKTWKDFKPTEYEITVDGLTMRLTASIITVGNSNQWGNGAKITPLASTSDGWLEITIVKPFHSRNIPALVQRLMDGTIDRSPFTIELKGRDILIKRPEEGPAHFDGDCFRAGKEISIKLSEEPLKVLVP